MHSFLSSISLNFFVLVAICTGSGFVAYHGLYDPRFALFIFILSGWVITLSLHEFGHAIAAFHGGDTQVAQQGYLTLDPLRYTHPVLSVLLPLAFLALGGIGLPGGAVYIRTSMLRSRAWVSLVSLAGPLFTLICFFMISIPIWLGLDEAGGTHGFWAGVSLLAFLQLSALAFNLLPLPGLDGFGVIEPWLPRRLWSLTRAIDSGTGLLIILVLFMLTPFGRYFIDVLFELADAFGHREDSIFFAMRLFRFWQ